MRQTGGNVPGAVHTLLPLVVFGQAPLSVPLHKHTQTVERSLFCFLNNNNWGGGVVPRRRAARTRPTPGGERGSSAAHGTCMCVCVCQCQQCTVARRGERGRAARGVGTGGVAVLGPKTFDAARCTLRGGLQRRESGAFVPYHRPQCFASPNKSSRPQFDSSSSSNREHVAGNTPYPQGGRVVMSQQQRVGGAVCGARNEPREEGGTEATRGGQPRTKKPHHTARREIRRG